VLIELVEYQVIKKDTISQNLLADLQQFDESHARTHDGETIFDWRLREIRAKNWVGVISIPGLTIEIAPKIVEGADQRQVCLANLIYMLAASGIIPFSERDVANLSFDSPRLIEAFISLFADAALTEIRRGVDRGYIHREEETAFAKGKIEIVKSLKSGLNRSQKLTVSYDSFVVDTLINQTLKAASRFLLFQSSNTLTQQKLREILVILGDVGDVPIKELLAQELHYHRANDRFQPLIEFCRRVLSSLNPNLAAGSQKSFALLFPMEELFESFVAASIRRFANRLGLLDKRILAQHATKDRHLLARHVGADNRKRCVKIRPDIVIEDRNGQAEGIIDTKWKRLEPDKRDERNGIGMSDLYQVYAYANHFDCRDNILLYPSRSGVTDKVYSLTACPDKRLHTRQIDIGFNLSANQERLFLSLKNAILPLLDYAEERNSGVGSGKA
jgi:5-methylcytosine-specific restriction enzyme subunit McrC